jgi:hypothetical protein
MHVAHFKAGIFMTREAFAATLMVGLAVAAAAGIIAAAATSDPRPVAPDQRTNVEAPGTRVETSDDKTRVEAPFTTVEKNHDGVRVKAPFVDIEVPKNPERDGR